MREVARLLVALAFAICAALGVAYVVSGVGRVADDTSSGIARIALGAVLVAIPVRATFWIRSRQTPKDQGR